MALRVFLLIIGIVHSIPLQENEQCGYKNCPKYERDVLNVHIVPHTHDDVGWLKTVDQYYYGSRNNIQKAGVQYIIDSVVKELWEDPNRKFIYVETAFFWKWWVRQPLHTQDRVRQLVSEGRLQFVGGAWSMNDEAASHYQSTIDQFTWGLRKLNETFGPCSLPRVGWQIDPFGHSREFASLLAGMGYDGLFLGRIDYQDKRERLRSKSMEMVWRGDDDLGAPSDIFTGVNYNTYSPPPGFCFDVLCSDEPIIDDADSPLFNVDDKIAMFIDYVKNQAKSYLTNNIMITMGGDFTYQDATMWYTNLDKLIQYTNLKAAKDGIDVKLYYSTPNCYLKAVREANPTLPTKQDDFFPYASDPNSFWTGYFTSRPTTKYFERRGNAYLQSAKQLQILAGLERHNEFVLDELKSAMGIMQHHDAITGTEKQHVTSDYVRILDQAVEDSLLILRQAFNKVIQGESTKPPIFTLDRCRLNESSCYTSENSDRFVVTLYNPIAWKVNESVRIPVTEGVYDVYVPNGDKIESQIVEIPKPILDIPSRQNSLASHEIVFIAYLKPLEFKSFYIQKHSQKVKITKRDINVNKLAESDKKNQDIYDFNEFFDNNKEKMDIDIKSIEDYGTGSRVNVNINGEDIINDNIDAYGKNNQGYTYISPDNQVKLVINGKNIDDSAAIPVQTNTYRNRNDDIQKIYKQRSEVKRFGRIRYPGEDIINDKFDAYSNNNQGYRYVSPDKQGKVVINDKNIEDSDALSMLIQTNTNDNIQNIFKQRSELKGLGRQSYPDFGDEEMRMLADDAMIVERLDDFFVIENENIKINIDNTSGSIKSIAYPHDSINMSINFYYYPGCIGNNEIAANRSSGAYIFRPNATKPTELNKGEFKVVNGNVVKEIQLAWSDNAFSTLRLYKNFNYLELDWLIGPIDVKDGIGKEYIVKYETDMLNNGEFYTDSNGRQVLKRKLNQRPQFNVSLEEPVGGNYYPVTNEIYIQDDKNRLTVLTDRSEGGSSLIEGELELMLHRRLLRDDAFGVGEALNEQESGKGLIVRGTHRIILSPIKDSKQREMENIYKLHLQPLVFVSNAKAVVLDDWLKLKNSYSWLKQKLPEGLHLLTVEPWDEKLLIRIENYLTKSDGAVQEVDLSVLLNNINIKSFIETNLSANEIKEKWNWNKQTEFVSYNDEQVKDDGFKVKIKPKQIRTFILDYDFVQ